MTYPSGLTNPPGMTVFNGRLFVVDNTQICDELWEIDPDGADSSRDVARFPEL